MMIEEFVAQEVDHPLGNGNEALFTMPLVLSLAMQWQLT